MIGCLLAVSIALALLSEGTEVGELFLELVQVVGLIGIWFAYLPQLARVPPRPLPVEGAFLCFYALVISGGALLCLEGPIQEALARLPYLLVSPTVAIAGGYVALLAATLTWIVRARRRIRRLTAESGPPPA